MSDKLSMSNALPELVDCNCSFLRDLGMVMLRLIVINESVHKESYSLSVSTMIKKKPLISEGLLIKVGDDLLSHNCSTIGAGGLNFSVRNGKRWNPAAIVT